MKLTVDILEEFIGSLSLTGMVEGAAFDGTNTILTLTNSFHLRAGMNVNISGTDYEVLGFGAYSNSITIAGDQTGLIGFQYTVPNPFFFHGTPVATASSIAMLDDASKVPMIYLYEQMRETDRNIFNSVKRSASMTLYFLDVANFADWTTDDFYQKRVLGLNKLVDAFQAALLDYGKFYMEEDEFTRLNMTKFGTFKAMKGYDSKVFNDNLTGVRMDFTLNIRRNCN
jgi:hypothetical protein